MPEPGAEGTNGTDPGESNSAEYANRLEMLDEAVEHVLLQLIESDFILTGPNGGVTRWGDRAKLLFGWETQRTVGSSLFDTVLGGDDEGPVRRWERYLTNREGDPPPARFSVRARHCDGMDFPLELTFVPVRLSQGSGFSFFVRDLTADLPPGAKLARLRRDHKDVLQSISSALSHGTPLDPDERLAGVLVAYAPTGPTPWVDAAHREAEEAAAALADVAEAGEKGGEGAAADRLARRLAKAKRAERSAEEAVAERQALQEQLTTAVERSEQLEREGAAIREALDDARRQASAAGEHAEQAQTEAESAHGDAAEAIRLVRELERQTQEVRGQLNQARGDSGEGAKRMASLERATEGATERLARLEQRAHEEAEHLGQRMEEALAEVAEARQQVAEMKVSSAEDKGEGLTRAEVDAAVGQLRDEVRSEAARTRDELGEVRQELTSAKAEVSEAKADLAELRELAAGVREATQEALAEARSATQAGEQAREAAEHAGTAAERSEETAARLAQLGGEMERAEAESSTSREEMASLRQEAEAMVRVLERSIGRALSDDPPDDPAEPAGTAPPELEPARDPREGFDDVDAPMAVLDLGGGFVELNRHFCELVGYTEEEFRTAIWPSSLSDEVTRREHRELRDRLATGEIEESPVETCYLHKEGLLVPVSGTVSLVRGEDGSPDHLLLDGAADRAALSG